MQASFFEATAVAKIGSSLKSNHHKKIWLAQIDETNFTRKISVQQFSENWANGVVQFLHQLSFQGLKPPFAVDVLFLQTLFRNRLFNR